VNPRWARPSQAGSFACARKELPASKPAPAIPNPVSSARFPQHSQIGSKLLYELFHELPIRILRGFMINAISSANPAGAIAPQQRASPPPGPASTPAPQDSVTLSRQALAAAGAGADRDGDGR